MEDIATLKSQLKINNDESVKLSDIVARKMEVIYRMEENNTEPN